MEVSAEMEAQLQTYLQEKGVEDLLKDIVVELCKETPDDVLRFIKEYITKRMGDDGADEDEDEDEAGDMGGVPAARTNRRGGVSADVPNLNHEGEIKIVPKNAATMASLMKSVSSNVLFQHLEPDELNGVLDAMFEVNVSSGDVVIQQGDEGDNFYVIDTGSMEIIIDKGNGGAPEVVGEINDGGAFGELALIYGTPRAATIKAKSAAHLWAIDRDTYRRILMGSTIRKRKTYEAMLEKVELLSSLDKWERLSVADALEPANFKAGDVIMKQGDIGNDFYIIEEGECVVSITEGDTTKEMGKLETSAYFGELALLEAEGTRKATVTAVTDVKLAKLDRDRFERVLGPCSDILKRNAENYAKFNK